jgi:hypothetical protein
MSEPTVTLRFPGRLHTQAKVEASRRGMSLQDFVAQAVENSLGQEAPQTTLPPIAGRIARLPDRSRKLTDSFIDFLELAPDDYIRAFEKHIYGSLPLFRRFGKKHFEETDDKAKPDNSGGS